MMIYTIEATSCKLDLSIVTWYFSTAEFNSKPSDTPANTCFVNRIINPGSIGINLYSNGRTSGGSKLEIGEVILENIDGVLDELARYSFDGRKFVIRRGDSNAAYPSGFKTIFIGTAESIDVNYDIVTFRLRDKSYLFDRPLLTAVYGGTNVLPAGIDGTADDLKGVIKPRVFGQCYNIPLDDFCVNTQKLIYQYGTNGQGTVGAVYDQGVALAFGVDRATNALMQANTPAGGSYDTCIAEGLIRLGSTPNGQVTCDDAAQSGASTRTVANLLKTMAQIMGVTAYAADVTALDALNSSVVGLWVNDDRTASETMDQLAESIGAYWYFDRLEQFRMGRLAHPSGIPVKTLYPYDIIDMRSIPANDKNVTVWKVTLNYLQNELVQQGADLAGAVTAARRSYLKKPYRKVIYETSLKAYSLLAQELKVNSRLTNATDAQNECDRLYGYYCVIPPRRIYEVTIDIDTFDYNLMDNIILDANSLRNSFFGAFTADCRLIGYNLDLEKDTATLTLW